MKINQIDLHTKTPLAQGVITLLKELEVRLQLSNPLGVYVAGGIAVHFYTAQRTSFDIDAEFSARIQIPNDLAVEIDMGDKGKQVLYFDTNYNSTFALMHEDYLKDAQPLELNLQHLKVFLLSPLDLAVSKIARFSENDREDIAGLVRANLTSSDEIKKRAEEAVLGFVGNTSILKFNIRDAVKLAKDIEDTLLKNKQL
jgi:hypothetical protein